MFALIALVAAGLISQAAGVETAVLNVRAEQIEGSDFVDVYFDLQGAESNYYNVAAQASTDNGLSWGVRMKNVSGDTGQIVIGSNKHIIWDAGRDFAKQFSTNMRIKVIVLSATPRQRVCPDIGDEGMVMIRGRAPAKNDHGVPDFCIDRWEYPNKTGEFPLVFVQYRKAEDYCRAAGKRLCTGVQWQIACTGGREIDYPYGAEYSKKRCNTEGDTLHPIGTDLACVSLHGVYDLSGNAYEWVSSPATKKAEGVVNEGVRGGNWYLGEDYGKCSKAGVQNADYATRHTGFRCCFGF